MIAGSFPVTVLWPSRNPRFRVIVTVAPLYGRLECVGVSIESYRSPRVIDSRVWRGFPVGEIIAKAVEKGGGLLQALEAAQPDDSPEALESLRPSNWDAMITEHGEEWARDWEDAHWAEAQQRVKERAAMLNVAQESAGPPLALVAEVYRTAPRHPTKTVADQLFDGHYRRAVSAVQKCRQPGVGLLPPTTQGRARATTRPRPRRQP